MRLTSRARKRLWRGYQRSVAVAELLISPLAQYGIRCCGERGSGLCGGATLLLDPVVSRPGQCGSGLVARHWSLVCRRGFCGHGVLQGVT
jgi:hypothetical protein